LKPETKRYLELLEQRIQLLCSLADNLKSARPEFIALDLNAMERRIAEQNRMCAQVRSLDANISLEQAHYAERTGVRLPSATICWPASGDGSDKETQEIRDALKRLATAQIALKTANDAHQAMLRGSRRTIKVLQNLYSSFAPTYSVPAAVAKSFEERV
jgi:hypothetical protein